VLVVPHDEYLKLADNAQERQLTYRALFNNHLSEKTLSDIRDATNKAWVLGSSHFKEKIEQQLNRRISPARKGGDRKSAAYRERVIINGV